MGTVVDLRPQVAVALDHPRCPRPIPYGTAEVITRHPNGVPSLILWQSTLVPLDKKGVERKRTGSFTLSIRGPVDASQPLSACPVAGQAADHPFLSDDGRLQERCPPGGIGEPS